MSLLGNGLSDASHDEEAVSVKEAELSMELRLGAPVEHILASQTNLANTYHYLGRHEQALRVRQEVYSGRMKLSGEEHEDTIIAALNYSTSLVNLQRFEEAKTLLQKTLPVARSVLGEGNETTLRLRWNYGRTVNEDLTATLEDLREAVTTLEETKWTAQRVLGGQHPLTMGIEINLQEVRAALRAREGDVEPLRAAVEAMAPGDA